MSCTKNPKRFLFVKYEGPHEMRLIKFGRFMACSKDFMGLAECCKCRIQQKLTFVTEEDLLKMGATIEQIAQGRNTIF